MVAVSIGTHLMMAQSLGYSDTPEDNDKALVKEMDNVGRTSSHNIWDDEW